MKKYVFELACTSLTVLSIAAVLVARQIYDPSKEVYQNEPAYNLQSVAFFVGVTCIALSIKTGNIVRIPAMILSSSFFFDMIKELTSLNDQNDTIQWVLYWFVVTLTTVYGVSEYRSKRR